MIWRQYNLTLPAARRGFHLITPRVIDAVTDLARVEAGLLHVFIQHTSASLTINENADPDVCRDMVSAINKLVPMQDGYRHREGNSAAHVKSSLFGASETLIINNGEVVLGTWQGIFFVDLDGPRTRRVWVSIV